MCSWVYFAFMKQPLLNILFGLFPFFIQAQPFNFYYGNLHAHSSYSDGNQDAATSGLSTPLQDYQYAKLSQQFHFLGIAEHNHYGAGMLKSFYAMGLSQANTANQDSVFVCMYGMEWGVIGPPGGHTLIYGINQLIGWDSVSAIPNYDIYNARLDYDSLFKRVARTPNAFACLAHPATTDYSGMFSTIVKPAWDSAIVGVAIRSGPAFSTDTMYNNPSTSSFEARYKDALKQGYHVGATLDHDNHNTTFGRMAKSRTVALAPALTRNNIIEAFRKRRTQASDDWNVQVTFTLNGKPLGTVFNDSFNASIQVSVYDPDMEPVSSIAIIHGIPGSGVNPTTLISNSSSATLNYTHILPIGGLYYYYAVITQLDGDKVYTSPIWYSKTSILPVTLIGFNAHVENKTVLCKWSTATEINSDQFNVERSNDGLNFMSIAQVPAAINSIIKQDYMYRDFYAPEGLVYYRLKQQDRDGSYSYSAVIAVNVANNKPEVEVLPNPFDAKLMLTMSDVADAEMVFELFNSSGVLVHTAKVTVANGEAMIDGLDHVKPGIYQIRLSIANFCVLKKVMKVI